MRISELPLTQENIIKITEYKEEDKMEKIEDIYTNAQPFVESELAEDVKERLSINSDTICSKELRDKIMAFKDNDVLFITRDKDNPVQLINVELVDEVFIRKIFI